MMRHTLNGDSLNGRYTEPVFTTEPMFSQAAFAEPSFSEYICPRRPTCQAECDPTPPRALFLPFTLNTLIVTHPKFTFDAPR